MNAFPSIQESYDKLWEIKLKDPEWIRNDGKGRVEFCANFLKSTEKFSSDMKILDVGCGRGTLGHYINSDVCLYGVDISKDAAEEARSIYYQADCVDLNREELPYGKNLFDMAVTLDVIEHVFDPLSFLKEIHRVLKPGGELVLSTPNILNENLLKSLVRNRKFPKTSGDLFPYDGGHIHFFTYQDIYDILMDAGFNSKPVGPLGNRFDYEYKETIVWVLGRKN